MPHLVAKIPPIPTQKRDPQMLTNHDGTIYIREGSKLEVHINWLKKVFEPEPQIVTPVKHDLTPELIHPCSLAARIARRNSR